MGSPFENCLFFFGVVIRSVVVKIVVRYGHPSMGIQTSWEWWLFLDQISPPPVLARDLQASDLHPGKEVCPEGDVMTRNGHGNDNDTDIKHHSGFLWISYDFLPHWTLGWLHPVPLSPVSWAAFPDSGFFDQQEDWVSSKKWVEHWKENKKLTALMSRNYQNPPFTVLNTLDPIWPVSYLNTSDCLPSSSTQLPWWLNCRPFCSE